ncbi:MAG: hypothetical protein NTY98_02745, partial [Verrucomicrobia bacterium]|nr:hypothetical protein [Verrucomicrobiota bacterium]
RSPWGRLPLKHAHRSHMRASEDIKPAPKLDAYAKSADEQRKLEEQKRRMDLNNTPRDLQGQISPHRAAEITNLTPQPPPSARAQPSLKDPPYQPPPSPPPQTFPMPAGSGVLRPPATGQQIPVNPNSYSIPAAPADVLAPPCAEIQKR